MQPPSLWYQSHPYRHHHPDITTPTHRVTALQGMEAMERGRDAAALTLVPVTPIPTSPPRHIELPPCKGMKRDAAPHTDE